METNLGLLVGHRMWQYKQDTLRSIYRDSFWLPKKIEEKKCYVKHTEGYLFCRYTEQSFGCGLYAMKNPITSVNHGIMLSYEVVILGSVYLWGQIEEHQFGYRAQYAYPRSFDKALFVASPEPILAELREKYL